MPGRSGRFARRNRLQTAADFRTVFNAATRCSSANFTALVRRNELGIPRLGVVLAKRHIPKAVTRNRVKRLVRESFRMRSGQLPGLDIVVIATPPIADCTRPQLRASLDRLWQKVDSCKAR